MFPITPFDRDTFLHAEVARLVGKWDVGAVFETGTYRGYTTVAFSLLCERTFTVEIDRDNYARSCEVFQTVGERGEIFAHCGSSPEVLEATLPEIGEERVLFYLDAHWQDYWPLLDELRAIARGRRLEPVLVIHDFKVPDRPDLGYDSYKGQDLDFDYVREAVHEVYRGEFEYHFNRVAVGACRGVLFVEPSK